MRQGASPAATGIELEHASEVVTDEEDEVADEGNIYNESNSQNKNMGKCILHSLNSFFSISGGAVRTQYGISIFFSFF